MSEDLPPDSSVTFRPGWPAIYPHGLMIARTSITQLEPADDDEIPEEEDEVNWILHVGTRSDTPRLAMFGDLTVKNPMAFAGVIVLMPFELRDEPEEITAEYRDEALKQYGEWASSFMYDHAATAMRAALAGNGLPLTVPFGTPEVALHLAGDHLSDGGDRPADTDP